MFLVFFSLNLQHFLISLKIRHFLTTLSCLSYPGCDNLLWQSQQNNTYSKFMKIEHFTKITENHWVMISVILFIFHRVLKFCFLALLAIATSSNFKALKHTIDYIFLSLKLLFLHWSHLPVLCRLLSMSVPELSFQTQHLGHPELHTSFLKSMSPSFLISKFISLKYIFKNIPNKRHSKFSTFL